MYMPVKLHQRDNTRIPFPIRRRIGMTLRDRLSVLQISAKSAVTRIPSYALVTSGVVLGALSVELISNWVTVMSHPLGATALIVFLSVSLVICSRALEQRRRQSVGRSERSTGLENEYETIFSRALDATLVFDDNGKCLQANPATADLFGVTEAQLSGCPFDRLAAFVPGMQSELLQ